jgi:hypothetical protein
VSQDAVGPYFLGGSIVAALVLIVFFSITKSYAVQL